MWEFQHFRIFLEFSVEIPEKNIKRALLEGVLKSFLNVLVNFNDLAKFIFNIILRLFRFVNMLRLNCFLTHVVNILNFVCFYMFRQKLTILQMNCVNIN